MKSKNVVLAIVAFTFAIGAAAASSFLASTIYVAVKYSANGPRECLQTPFQCNELTGAICKVTIPLQSGSGVAQSGTTIPTYKAGCSTLLTSNEDTNFLMVIDEDERPYAVIP